MIFAGVKSQPSHHRAARRADHQGQKSDDGRSHMPTAQPVTVANAMVQ
jgi:hypothetical protein